MNRWVYDEAEYESGSKWFARWHREQPDDDAVSIDLDSVGYCRRCLDPIYLIEATRGRKRKNAAVTERMGRLLGAALDAPVTVWVVYQDKTGAHPGEILVDNRTAGVNLGWLPQDKVWRMLQAIRAVHTCAQYLKEAQ